MRIRSYSFGTQAAEAMEKHRNENRREVRVKSNCRLAVLAGVLGCGICPGLMAQQNAGVDLRAPATPLIVHDPYFSVWSDSDQLTGGPTRHWTGAPQELNGIVRIDGKNYRYLGEADRDIPALQETQRKITPTRTIVTLQNPQVEIQVCFLTPAFPDDMKIMARPVTYLTWEAKSRDGANHDVTLYLDIDGTIATNTPMEPVVWSRAKIAGLHLLRVGTEKQPMLEKWGDNLRIDWGYFYVGVPDAQGEASLAAGNHEDRDHFVATGELPTAGRSGSAAHAAKPLSVAAPAECRNSAGTGGGHAGHPPYPAGLR